MAVFLFMCACVCSEWKRSLQSSSPIPLHRRIISPPSETKPRGSGSLHWPTLSKKAALGRRAAELKFCFCCCHCHHNVPSPHRLSHPTLLFKLSFSGFSRGPGSIERPLVQQQFRIMAWETGRSCQHLINRTHPVLMTHKIWRKLSQKKTPQAVVQSMTHSRWTITKALNMRRLPFTCVTVTWKLFYFELQSLDNKVIISSGQSKSWLHGNWSL